MKTLYTMTAALLFTSGAAYAAMNDSVVFIDNIDEHMDGKRISVSGVVTDLDGNDEFTLSDKTGNIEVNLTGPRSDLEEGDVVTVLATIDKTLIDELDNAQVSIVGKDFKSWHNSYYETYNIEYDAKGLDIDFYENL